MLELVWGNSIEESGMFVFLKERAMSNSPQLSLDSGQRARKTILIVEDDASIGELLALIISQESEYQPVVARTSRQALEVLGEVKPDLLIIDYYLAKENGLDLYDQILSRDGFEATPAVFLTAADEQHRLTFEQRHLVVLEKPFDLDTLLDSIVNQLHPTRQADLALF
jgi:DNA-binding response OmpR family regulator